MLSVHVKHLRKFHSIVVMFVIGQKGAAFSLFFFDQSQSTISVIYANTIRK